MWRPPAQARIRGITEQSQAKAIYAYYQTILHGRQDYGSHARKCHVAALLQRSAEYRERIVAHARRACGSGAPEDKVLKAAMYYAVKWTGLSEQEARRIFIDNEPSRPVTLDDLNPEVRDWLLSFETAAAQ